MVQKWRPKFVPGEDDIQKMQVWVRLSKLPMEWIDVDMLRIRGGMLGITYKTDPITESQAWRRFARICVETDVTKPLKNTLKVEDRSIKVEYESLCLICFNCGRIRHSREACMEGRPEHIEEVQPYKKGNENNDAKSEPFGP
ncbi:hypothetical protein Ddye_013220 [Dipteronia dyeriana]|uniref:Zinc knuckle CX2CX4HX4C domain-containing protein n=1 Tax=Dipteronia dyeriana TaxID=168575 RepID=A0AAE0CJF0_9ROSI|nr:hypothetical protein Ddye_013220 [Dipteronia dyeriana]